MAGKGVDELRVFEDRTVLGNDVVDVLAEGIDVLPDVHNRLATLSFELHQLVPEIGQPTVDENVAQGGFVEDCDSPQESDALDQCR